ncbi:MAG TPA: inositol monophosphatase family protein [Longimicrobiales bacterium]
MSTTEYRDLLDTAVAAARAAVDVHRRHLGRVRVEDWSEKGVADFVTHVDREAEERILALVNGRFPEHAVLAEEGATAVAAAPAGSPAAAAPAEAEWLWIVDPLDGTTNFLHGYPMYSVSVAVLHRGAPVAGAVVSGATGEEWTAMRGGGAFRDGRRIRVSDIERLKLALIGTGFPFKTVHELPRYLRHLDGVLRNTAGVRRGGSAALDLCHLASGHLDGFWELSLAPWDIAAGVLVVQEAGGIVTAVDGGPVDLRAGGSVLAGNPRIHAALRTLLASLD